MPGAEVEIKPGGKGDFIVTADGRVLWDKRRKNGDEFPPESVIVDALQHR